MPPGKPSLIHYSLQNFRLFSDFPTFPIGVLFFLAQDSTLISPSLLSIWQFLDLSFSFMMLTLGNSTGQAFWYSVDCLPVWICLMFSHEQTGYEFGGKTLSVLSTYQHTWRQHDPVVPWTWITWRRGSLSGFCTNSYYFLFSTHALIRRESFLLLILWHHLAACGILVPWAETSTLAVGGPLDFFSRVHLSAGEGSSSGLISAVAVCSWSWTSSGQFCSTLRHQHQVSGIHPEAPPPGVTASLVLSPLGLYSGWVNNLIILLK